MEIDVLTISVFNAGNGDRYKVYAGEQDVTEHFVVRMGELEDGRSVIVVEEREQ